MTAQSTPEQSAAYKAGLCKAECGRRYAAGMTTCLECRHKGEGPETPVSQQNSQHESTSMEGLEDGPGGAGNTSPEPDPTHLETADRRASHEC